MGLTALVAASSVAATEVTPIRPSNGPRPAAPATVAAPPAITAAQPTDRVMGRANAPVTIIEYASFTCSHCAIFSNEVLPVIKRRYIDTGKVKLIFRDLPTPPQQISTSLAAIGRCAQDGKFFEVSDYLMQNQEEAFRTRAVNAWIRGSIALTGKSEQELLACMSSQEQQQALEQDVSTAIAQGITGTPTVFVNGERASTASLEAISQLIDKHLP